MAIYKKRGFSFTKNIVIPNKDKTKYLFGFQISIGINADEPAYFYRTSNWIFIGGGFNLLLGNKIPGFHLRWNVKEGGMQNG